MSNVYIYRPWSGQCSKNNNVFVAMKLCLGHCAVVETVGTSKRNKRKKLVTRNINSFKMLISNKNLS